MMKNMDTVLLKDTGTKKHIQHILIKSGTAKPRFFYGLKPVGIIHSELCSNGCHYPVGAPPRGDPYRT